MSLIKFGKCTKILLLLIAFSLTTTITEGYCFSNSDLKKPVIIENYSYATDIYAENHSRVKLCFFGMVYKYYNFCCVPPLRHSSNIFMEFSKPEDSHNITRAKRGPPDQIFS